MPNLKVINDEYLLYAVHRTLLQYALLCQEPYCALAPIDIFVRTFTVKVLIATRIKNRKNNYDVLRYGEVDHATLITSCNNNKNLNIIASIRQ